MAGLMIKTIKRGFLRAKWTVARWFMPTECCTACKEKDGYHRLDCTARYPGEDDQFTKWNGSVMCVRCRDYFNRHDPDDGDVKLIAGEWVCDMCRKGREDNG